MRKLSKLNLAFIIIISILLIYIGNNYKSDKSMSYNEFNTITKEIYDKVLVDKYNVKPVSPIFTAYPSNPTKYPSKPNEKWTKNYMDMIDNDLSSPKKISMIVYEKDIFTKIDFVYAPRINDKIFFNINRIDEYIEELKELKKSIPGIYVNSFTTNGIYIEITSFYEERGSGDRGKIVKQTNGLILAIQNYIVENNL